MGYKLAGYDHLGGVEIDPKVAEAYKANHSPVHLYVEDIRVFNERTDLPDELYSLDILDGSPPCSSFSMAGSREKGWGKKKVFREGQAHQRLDDLVFAYVDTIAKLRPKVAILENVKGIISGNAKVYSKAIVNRLRKHGYTVQVFLLNAATMGVPQMRERVFFIARLDSSLADLVLDFNEDPIPFGDVFDHNEHHPPLSASNTRRWHSTGIGCNPVTKSGNNFGYMARADNRKVARTTLSGNTQFALQDEPCEASVGEYISIQSFPQDYVFGDVYQKHLLGMSVPPVMMAQIAHQINVQWFNPL